MNPVGCDLVNWAPVNILFQCVLFNEYAGGIDIMLTNRICLDPS